ncbi:MAG TPA: hypothetical protein GX691_00625 [Clostridia bacterium]|nr:hypothetical protein [Clostridia bacterium]
MRLSLKPNSRIKRILVVTFCLILLFSAWFFRWEEVATKTVEGARVTYETDRWTGRTWIKLHGVTNSGKLVEGTETPYISPDELKPIVAEIIAGPLGEKRKQYLQNKKKEIIEKENQVKKGHTQYVQLYEKYEQEFYTSVIHSLPFSMQDPLYEINIATEKQSYIWGKIPKKIHEDNRAWKSYKNQLTKIDNQINDMSDWATTEAEKIIKAKAYTTRKIATGLWFFLLVLILLGTSISGFLCRKKSHSEPI